MSTTTATDFSAAAEKSLEHLHRELNAIRTGRANPALVEEVLVEAYGTPTPLIQLAAINAPEPRMIVIQPWDPSVIRDIEKALSQSPLGITPVVDGKTIRLPFPSMTEERRIALTKAVHEKGEEAKVSLRSSREDIVKHLRTAERDGSMSEDVVAAELKDLQQLVDEAQERIGSMVAKKVEELTTI